MDKIVVRNFEQEITFTCCHQSIKTISKEGGLDQYLLKSTPARVKTMGLKAWQLRYRILQEREQNREEMSPYWMVQLSQSNISAPMV